MSLVKFDPDRRSEVSSERSDFRAHWERFAADAVRSIGRQWRLIAAVGAIALVLASLAIPLLPRSYSATAIVYPSLFSSEEGKPATAKAMVDATTIVNSELRMIRSDAVLQEVVKRLELDRRPEASQALAWFRSMFFPETHNHSPVDRAVALLRNKLVVSKDVQSYLIYISYSARSAEDAAGIVNAVALEYVRDKFLQRKRDAVATAESELTRLLAIYGEKHPRILQVEEALTSARAELAAVKANAKADAGQDAAAYGDAVKMAVPNGTPTGPKGLAILAFSMTGGLFAGAALAVWRDRKRPKRKKAGTRQARSRSLTRRSAASRETAALKSWLESIDRLRARLAGAAPHLALPRLGPSKVMAAPAKDGAETGGGGWRGVKRLIEKASATLVDQCAVSGGNFMLNVLLARTLVPSDYGEFALFLGAIYLCRTVDYSFISYPLSIRLFGVKDDERAALLGKTAALAVALSLVLVVAMALGIMLLGGLAILLPACLCSLCWAAQEMLRRFVLADFRYRAAVAGDAVAYVGQGVLVAILLYFNSVTLPLALYAMSVAFAAGALVHASKLRFAWPDRREMRRELPGLARDYIAVGKWSAISYQLVLVRVQLLPWMLAAVVGTVATASFQAAMNIAAMMNPVILGIGNAIPQTAAQAHRSGGVTAAARAVSGYVLFGLGPLLVMCAAGVLMPGLLLSTVYGASSPYLAVVIGVQLLVVAGVFDYIAEMFSKTLLGIESGRLALVVNAVAVATCLGLALIFIDSLGVVMGSCLALLVANVTRALLGAAAIGWLMMQERSRARSRLTTIGDTINDAAGQIRETPAE